MWWGGEGGGDREREAEREERLGLGKEKEEGTVWNGSHVNRMYNRKRNEQACGEREGYGGGRKCGKEWRYDRQPDRKTE